jgi:P2 family phage contractile tail tube protein
MSVKTNQINNCNIYVNGNNLLGRAVEVDAPEVKFKMTEFKGLGLIGSFDLPAGMDKMSLRIKWNAFYEDVFPVFVNAYEKIQLMIRASMEKWEGGEKVSEAPVIIYATCQSNGFPLGKFKQQDNVEVESTLSCTHCKIEIDGKEVMEVDFMNNIFKVNGEDKLAQYRANIGA